jgi:hypothetical protein
VKSSISLLHGSLIISNNIGPGEGIGLPGPDISLILGRPLHQLRAALGAEDVRVLVRLASSAWLQWIVHELAVSLLL